MGAATNRVIVGAALAMALGAGTAAAQTAGDINRLNAAMQICNSPMGAGMAECAKLGAMTGGLGGPAGGAAAGLAGLLGAAMSARTPQPAMPMSAPNGAALQQAVAACVQNAAGNITVIQACAGLAKGGAPAMGMPMAAPAMPAGQQMLPSDARAQASAMATHAAAQQYQACVAANPTAWQACLQTMNNNTQTGLLNAGVSAAQLQAAGGYVPPGYAGAGAAAAAAPAAAKAIMGLFGR